MSEKRFEVENERTVYDNLLHRGFVCSWKVDAQELVGLLNSLYDENEQLRQKIKHCVYVDVDNAKGCMNCKYDEGSICSILNCGTHDYLEGVSECGLKYWEGKDE